MALGIQQTATITDAAHRCALTLRSLGRNRIRTQAAKSLNEPDPEAAMSALMTLAFKASLQDGAAIAEALPVLQQQYHHVLLTWTASPSLKHRKEMVRLFRRELKK